ncbi:hypothetical protein KUCAC02_008039 [Chaenocephalus aceratus]|uniref:Uncharacterized protein n=1 Tax=Chaenocephalus aceratus TaxID=36190 RepID=A0ACB9X940_CHAAC|nr:hypothetical protein KUCAC02_008039 [Chaenocephalus aceratus]
MHLIHFNQKHTASAPKPQPPDLEVKMYLSCCVHESENNGLGVMRSRHFISSEATPVNTKTIRNGSEEGGDAEGPEDFSVTESRGCEAGHPQ